MSSTSPRIFDEPKPSKAPLFLKNPSFSENSLQASTSISSPLKVLSPMKIPCSIDDKENVNNNINNCSCPHVLIADDDPLQVFYYQHLFLKSMSFDDLVVGK